MQNKISLILIIMVVMVLVAAPQAMAAPEVIEIDEENQIDVHTLHEGGDKLESAGNRMRRAFWLSMGAYGAYIAGTFVSIASPEVGLALSMAGLGLSLWATIEDVIATGEIRDAGEYIKRALGPEPRQPAW